MASFTKVNDFVVNLANAMDMNADTFKVALCATDPTSGTSIATDGNGVLANATEISYTNLSDRTLANVTSTQTGGTYKLSADDKVLTASGGSVAAFRYVIIYNDSPTSPADPIVGYYDYGSALTLNDGDTFTIDIGANGILTLTQTEIIMAKLFNRAKMNTSSTGAGTITLGSAETGFQTFADAGVANGDVVQYVIEEGANWEIGTGTYSSSGTTLTRSPSESSGGGSALSLGGGAKVSITVIADDFKRLQLAGTTKAEATSGGLEVTGNIVVSGAVDGRDLATDGTKLDGIEASATADQTAAEIRTLVESATDSNVFTDADHTKLNGIEASATADQTASEILTALLTVDGPGSGLNADVLDGLDSGSFLRADAADTASSAITFSGGNGAVTLSGGTSDIRSSSNTWSGESHGKLQYHSNSWYMQYYSAFHHRNSGGTNTMYLDSSGNVTYTGNVTAYSDIKFKKDIVTIDNPIDKIKAMRGVYYKEIETDRPRTGVIAQELEEVLPEVVMDIEDTNPTTGETTSSKAVDYGNMVGLLIEAIKEQQDEIERLRAIIEG